VGIAVRRDVLEREIARRGWTHADLARAAGLSAATVTSATAGRRVSPRTLQLIVKALLDARPLEGVDSLLL
jgi:lambda repressor-like predicted transcriptional regulator